MLISLLMGRCTRQRAPESAVPGASDASLPRHYHRRVLPMSRPPCISCLARVGHAATLPQSCFPPFSRSEYVLRVQAACLLERTSERGILLPAFPSHLQRPRAPASSFPPSPHKLPKNHLHPLHRPSQSLGQAPGPPTSSLLGTRSPALTLSFSSPFLAPTPPSPPRPHMARR